MKKLPAIPCLVLSTLALACTNGGGGEGGAAVTLALTDAASDELASFTVQLDAVQLVRPGGALVGVLPSPVTVDLLTLEDVSQVLNVVNVPPGLYSGASVSLDFSAAEAWLVGESTPATILDGDGNPLAGSVQLPVSIGNALSAVAGRNRVLELDFDLDQSVLVDAGSNAVFVEPVLVVRVDRNDPKELVVAGVVQSVDQPGGTIAVELQTLAGQPVRDLVVAVGPQTVYQVDGVPALGASGLSALAGAGPGTWLQCYGAVDPNAARLDAAYVEAGSGTYNGGSDIVEGFVVGRVGGAGADPILTVLGHSNDATHTSFFFNTSFTVGASFADTRVVRRGLSPAFDTDDVNVGQRVRVFGDLNGFTLDASAPQAVIRLQPTRVLGFANGAPAGSTLALDVERVAFRDASAFAWSEGGTTPADPDDLQADVAGLASGLGIVGGTAVALDGWFSAVDDAGADFVATSVVNRDLAPSLLVVHDRSGGLSVTPTVSASAITLALQGSPDAGEFALIDRGFVGATSLPTSPDPSITPASGLGLYFLRDRTTGVVSLQLDFGAFAAALDLLLAQGAVLYNLGAIGTYDPPTNAMESGFVIVVVD